MKPFFLLWFFIRVTSSRNGFISEVLINKRFDCPLASKKVYTVKSELQCTHRCLHDDMCELISYNTEQNVEGNCEVASQLSKCSIEHEMVGWNAVKFKVRLVVGN